MQKNPVLPEWFSKLIDKFKLNQSWLTINVNEAEQLSGLSQDQIAFFMNMVKLMQADLPQSQLADEILSLGQREVEEKVTAIDVVLSRSQRVCFQLNTINKQVNHKPTQHIQQQTVHIGTQNNFFGMPVSSVPSISIKSDGPFRDSFGLPPAFDDFTGREDSLALLEANIGKSTVISHPKKTVSGTGGIGKTQLAVTFAHSKLKQYRETQGKSGYRSIIWFIAGTDEGIDNHGLMTEQMNRLGRQLGFDPKELTLEALIKLIFEQLEKKHAPCLVVFDNAQNLRSIKSFLPPSTVPIIITTRNNNERDWDQTFKPITLSVFSPTEAHDYIKKVLCRNHPDLYREAESNALAKALGYFPLALTQALAYISTENIQISEYVEAFSQQKEKYLQEPVPQGDPYQEDKNPSRDGFIARPKEEYDPQKATVWAVIQLSLKKVTNPNAKHILKACAYLAPEVPIDISLLSRWTATSTECREAISVLRHYSLLENVTLPNHVRIHQLVQEILKLEDNQKTQGRFLTVVTEFMGLHYEKEENPVADEARQKILFPHCLDVLAQIEKLGRNFFVHFVEIVGNLQRYIAHSYGLIGNSVESARCYKQALTAFESSDNQMMILETMVGLGAATLESGETLKARSYFERALNILESIGSLENLWIAKILENLGVAILNQGEWMKAKELFESALAINRQFLKPNHRDVGRNLMNLGNAARLLGDKQSAENFMEEALPILEQHYGPNHPEVAKALNIRGALLTRKEDLERAGSLFERALTIIKCVYGANHPEEARILNNQGEVSRKMGDLPGAKILFKRALDIKENFYGTEHQELVMPLINLGKTILALDDTEGALVHYKRALMIKKSFIGPEDPEVIQTLGRLHVKVIKMGTKVSDSGDPIRAMGIFKQMLSIEQCVVGESHPMVAHTLCSLSGPYKALKELSVAQDLLKRALSIEKNAYGKNSLEVAHTRASLGFVLLECNQLHAALKKFNKCAGVFLDHYGNEHYNTVTVKNAIHELENILAQGNIQHFSSSHVPSTEAPYSPDVAIAQQNLAAVGEDKLIKAIIRILETEISIGQLLQVTRYCFERELLIEALILLEYVLEREPLVSGLLLRARCQLGRCDFSAASETASLCQAFLEGNDKDVNHLLSEIEKTQQQAMQWQAEMVALQSQPVLNAKEQVKLVINFRRLNRFEEALTLLDKILASKPSVDILAPAYFNQAQCYFGVRRYEDAQKSANMSYQLNADHRAELLIKKIKLAIEIMPHMRELIDRLKQCSAQKYTL